MSKINLEVAEAEFDRFVECMGLLLDTSTMDVEDKTAFDKQKNRIIDAMISGHLVINDDGEAVYTPFRHTSGHKEPITFHERTGASVLAMDGKKKGHDMAKTYAIMAEMCKVHPATFSRLAGPDIKTCEAVYALLMD
jgi:hypothetical protein